MQSGRLSHWRRPGSSWGKPKATLHAWLGRGLGVGLRGTQQVGKGDLSPSTGTPGTARLAGALESGPGV